MRDTVSRQEIWYRAAPFRRARIVVLTAFALWATSAAGAECTGNPCTTSASVTIVSAPLHVKAKKDLRFGTISDCQKSAGTIIISSTGGMRKVTGGTKVEHHDTSGPAVFLIRGGANESYVIEVPSGVTAERQGFGWPLAALNLPGLHLAGLHLPLFQGHGPPLQVDDLTVFTRTLGSSGPFTAPVNAKLDGSGDDLVKVGGTLTVPKNAKPGYYTAEITLSVHY
jgi:hypothetical protein